MRILVLGAKGFLGSRLVDRLIQDSRLGAREIKELVLSDIRPVDSPSRATMTVTQVIGDLADKRLLEEIFSRQVDVIFHLAATLTLEAEQHFLSGLQTNVLGLIDLLERCRAQTKPPMLLFASSISTFGGELPAVVGDDIFQAPTTSYGTQKVIAEHLMADYSRHGYLDGRALRLPIVVTHPGPASGSISDQVAALTREPLRGQKVVCRIPSDSQMVVATVDKVIDGFIRLAILPEEAIQHARTMNLPGLTVTPQEITEAVNRKLGDKAGQYVDWAPDQQVRNIIEGWPKAFTSARALALGITPNQSVDEIVESFISSERNSQHT